MTPSRRGSWLALLLTFVLQAPSLSPGPRAVGAEFRCPRCRAAVSAREVSGLRPLPIPDRDLCRRYAGDQPYAYDVWACDSCGFAALAEDFRKGGFPAPESLRAVPEDSAEGARPALLGKYLRAYEYYKSRGEDGAFLGDLLQRGAWAHRLSEIALDVPGKDALWIRVLQRGGDGCAEYRLYELAAESIPPTEEDPGLRLLKMEWQRRSGGAREVAAALEGPARYRGELADQASRIRALADGELLLLRMAEMQWRGAIDGGSPPKGPRVATLFLLGELNRRIGEEAAARKFFALVVEDPASSDQLVDWAWEQLRTMRR